MEYGLEGEGCTYSDRPNGTDQPSNQPNRTQTGGPGSAQSTGRMMSRRRATIVILGLGEGDENEHR